MIGRRQVIAGLTCGLSAGCRDPGGPALLRELYEGEQTLYEAAREEGRVVSLNTGPAWANWAALFEAFERRYPGIRLAHNDVGSGVAVTAMEAARANPQGDTCYYFASSAVDAAERNLVAPHSPPGLLDLAPPLRASDGRWFVVHGLKLVFVINRRLVSRVPTGWLDLAEGPFRRSIVYLDPRTAGQGQIAFLACNLALGGSYADLTPGAELFGRLHREDHVLRVTPTTPFAQFLRGEIPIWIAYENDATRAHAEGLGDAVQTVTPSEGSIVAPYAMSLVDGAPHPQAGRLWLNFVMSDTGQGLFAAGGVRPVRGSDVSEASAAAIDVVQAAAARISITDAWARAALGRRE